MKNKYKIFELRQPESSDVVVIKKDMLYFKCPFCKNLHTIKVTSDQVNPYDQSIFTLQDLDYLNDSALRCGLTLKQYIRISMCEDKDYKISYTKDDFVYKYPYILNSFYCNVDDDHFCHLRINFGQIMLYSNSNIRNKDRAGTTDFIPMIPYCNWGKHKLFG
jgi:hypothetical protein